jgi:UDP-N-acetylglucosamine 2-epimerase (non-hydrolysing)
MGSPVVHITGARPNFPKAAPVIKALREYDTSQLLVHTGQHYDATLSEIFFRQLGLPEPDINLGVGSGSHASQTAAIMVGLERLFLEETPALVVVYGDVNSTVAAALVAAKLQIPIAHVEAGLRSFDMTMPEEINRRLTDQLSDLLFVTSPEAIGHLTNEGLSVERIHFVGNPMIDTLLDNLDRFDSDRARAAYDLPARYAVATLHRPSNVDDPVTAKELVGALQEIADEIDLLIPLHPRGRKALGEAGLGNHKHIHVREPLGYVEFVSLVRGATAVLTDSGGVQEETTILRVPCLTMRPNTERPITITHGTNWLVSRENLVPAFRDALRSATRTRALAETPPLWDGKAGSRIGQIINHYLSRL